MIVGLGVVLFVVGAILAFGLEIEVSWANVNMIGYILMGVGTLVFIAGLWMFAARRRSSTITRTDVDPGTGERVTRTDSRSSDEI